MNLQRIYFLHVLHRIYKGHKGSVSSVKKFAKEEKKFIIILIIFFVFECAIGSIQLDMFDFNSHMSAAKNIALGKMLYRDHHGFYYGDQWVDYPYPPIYLYVVGGIFYLFGYNPYYAKVFLSLVNTVNAFLIYLILRTVILRREKKRENERRTAYLVSILYMLDPTTNAAVYAGNFDSFALLFILSAIYFYIHEWKWSAVFVGVSIGLGTMVKLFPIILVMVFLAGYYSKKEDTGSKKIKNLTKNIALLILSTALTILAISLPFLYACPNEYLEYALLYHFRRETTSISLAYYFLDYDSLFFLPMTMQICALSILLFVKESDKQIIPMSVYALSSFLTFSRVTYPKYWTLISGPLWLEIGKSQEGIVNNRKNYLLLFSYAILLLGCGIWDIPYLNGNYDFKSDILFFVGAGIYAAGALSLTFFTFRSLSNR